MAVGIAEWLPGNAEQTDRGSFPAEVSALGTDARAMGHLVEESEAAGVDTELPRLSRRWPASRSPPGTAGGGTPC
ncbi:hypothetical protein ACSNOK_01855 [Streptomyces sp. URMC 126]|uniref:imine reductase family protein n=1 Tax=Streptomyces sp. URMC 126 TaxID=3423401 RepID=UPI003F1D8B49